MPMNVTRYGVAPFTTGSSSINGLDQVVPQTGDAGVNVSGSVQVTGVLLLAAVLAVVVIARAMGAIA